MQNLVVLMQPPEYAYLKPLKAGNMILNRFCIDEDAACELSGIHYLKEASWTLSRGRFKSVRKRKAKGTEYFYSTSGKSMCQNFINLL